MSANLRAFLALIRWAEGTAGEYGYRTMVGGRLFNGWTDHPRQMHSGVFNNGTAWRSTAAGAYQFLASTWDEARAALGLPDFSPKSQDEAAVWLIKRAGALDALEEGRLKDALIKCSPTWASLPYAPYGQPTRTYADCERYYLAAGGFLSQAPITSPEGGRAAEPAPAPISQAPAGPPPAGPSPPPAGAESAPTKETRMPLPVAVAVGLATELWRLLRPTEKVAQVAGAIEKATPILLEAAKQTVPTAVNEQQAVEQIRANPQLQSQFRSQAMMRWDDLAPIWEAEQQSRREAREFGAEMTGTGPVWRQVGAGLLIGVLSLTIILGGGVLFWQMLESPQLDPGQKGLVLGALLAAFTSAVGYWFGSSASGRLKDQTIADQARR